MFYEELKQIIRSVLQQGLSGQLLMEASTADVNPAEIYASEVRFDRFRFVNNSLCWIRKQAGITVLSRTAVL